MPNNMNTKNANLKNNPTMIDDVGSKDYNKTKIKKLKKLKEEDDDDDIESNNVKKTNLMKKDNNVKKDDIVKKDNIVPKKNVVKKDNIVPKKNVVKKDDIVKKDNIVPKKNDIVKKDDNVKKDNIVTKKNVVKKNNNVSKKNAVEDEDVEKWEDYEKLRDKLEKKLDEEKIDHGKKLMECRTLIHFCSYVKINNLTGQVFGTAMEKYIKEKYNMTKNNASKCIGDLQYKGENIEIKCSMGGKNGNRFNFLGLRMNHKCSYMLFAYYLDKSNLNKLGEVFIFKLTKDDMKTLIVNYGEYSHGNEETLGKITIEDLNDDKNCKEYSLRPKYGDDCWKKLLIFKIKNI